MLAGDGDGSVEECQAERLQRTEDRDALGGAWIAFDDRVTQQMVTGVNSHSFIHLFDLKKLHL